MAKPKYRIVYEDPDHPEQPSHTVVPAEDWLNQAMNGELPPIWVLWELQDDEQKAMNEGWHTSDFTHDMEKWKLQETAPRVPPLTEEQAMEYLAMMVVPRNVWAQQHNRPMMRICRVEEIPTDRTWRDAWSVN